MATDIARPAARRSRVVPTHNLMPGSPDVSEFPRNAWAASTRRALTNAPTEALRMGDPRGRPELRDALAEYLARARGVRTSPESIVICAGVRHGVELLAPVFERRRPIAVEAYGLFIFRDAIAAMGMQTVPIGLDEYGAVVSDLDALDAPAVLLTPAHHSPHGHAAAPVATHRRRRLGATHGRLRPRRRLRRRVPLRPPTRRRAAGAVPRTGRYLGSTSKSLSQALRLGWMVLPDDLVDPVIAAAGGAQFYVDAIAQLTMAEFITSGQYDRHIRRMRTRYRRRRDALVDALAGFDVGISGLSAGVNVLLTLPDGTEHEVLRRAGEAGVALQGLSRDAPSTRRTELPDPDGIVVGFAAPAEHAFARAVDALRNVLIASGLRRSVRS